MNIYVGNLDNSVSEKDLKKVFSEFGEISSINIIKNKASGQPSGFAFIEMSDSEEAEKAIKELNESELKGNNIKVNQAKPRDDNPKNKFGPNRPQNRFGSDRQQRGFGGSRLQKRDGDTRPSRKPGI